jgi:short-subunit dehydrogenase
MTFAHYLADKGFNLILIERDIQPLNDIEISLTQKFNNNPPIIHKIEINKFDPESLSKKFMPLKDLPVKLFINCKNSKRKSPRSLTKHGEGEYQ